MSEKINQEVQVVENQISSMNEIIASLPAVITTQAEYDQVYEVNKNVHKLLQAVDKKEKAITKPINDSLKQIRDMFRPFKTIVESAKKDLSARREVFIKAEEERKRKEAERVARRVEKGTMREDTAVSKLANLEEEAVDTRGGMTSVLVVEVIDKSQIPGEYLIVDETAIKAAYREGKTIPGVNCKYEKRAKI